VNIFGVITFVHKVKIRVSPFVALNEEFLSVRDIVNGMLGDLQTGYELVTSID